jgi:hypothetical protein
MSRQAQNKIQQKHLVGLVLILALALPLVGRLRRRSDTRIH